MKKFEYCMHGVADKTDINDIIDKLDVLGSLGWEIFSVLESEKGGLMFFMKRELDQGR